MNDEKEFERYNRQILIPEIGLEGQKKLNNAKILVIGAGGLGSPVLLYLAAAGIGKIGIVEFDRIDRSNLHRQILFIDEEVGELKGKIAETRLKKLNPKIEIILHPHYISAKNALSIIGAYDLIIDGSDNLPTRYLINDACELLGKPFVFGAIYRLEGQVGFFNHLLPDGSRTACYRDLYPIPPEPDLVPTCNSGGVLGALAGIIGSAMACEAIKWAAEIGGQLDNKIWVFDALDFSTKIIGIKPNKERSAIKELIDYELFCDSKTYKGTVMEITPTEASSMIKKNIAVLIDVRDPSEFNFVNAGGINIPLEMIIDEAHRIPRKANVIFACQSGKRSAIAVKKLQNLGFNNLFSIRGGLNRWRAEVDPNLPAC